MLRIDLCWFFLAQRPGCSESPGRLPWFVMMVFVAATVFSFNAVSAEEPGPIAWWRFDEVRSEQVVVAEEEGEEEAEEEDWDEEEDLEGNADEFEDDEEIEETEEDEDDSEIPEAGDDSDALMFRGGQSYVVDRPEDFDLFGTDFTVFARVDSDQGGTIFARAPKRGPWAENGMSLFLAGGQLVFDIGFVGAVESESEVQNGEWHDVALTYDQESSTARLYVDGDLDAEDQLEHSGEAPEDHVIRIGFTSPDFPEQRSAFRGAMRDVCFYNRALEKKEIAQLGNAARSGQRPVKGLVGYWTRFADGGEAIADEIGGRHRARDEGEIEELEEEGEGDEEDELITEERFFVREEVSGTSDTLIGFHAVVGGVSGKALQLGGINSYVTREAELVGSVEAFSMEAWIALGAYPVHWVPILGQQAGTERGGFFGIDAYGHLGLKLVIDGEWTEVVTEERIDLGRWAHVACVYQPREKMQLFLDGRLVGEESIAGTFNQAVETDLLIGKHSVRRRPLGTIRPNATKEVHTYFDGILDELKVFGRAVSPGEIAASHRQSKPDDKPDLLARRLPAGPAGPGKFGAFYTTLKYYDAWDALWRVGRHADVVVRFDENPCRFVFWRGTSYIPHWVTENGIWYDNEFNETWSEHGCHEPMSDKQCRHAHVRIIESNDARVVVHWRYALVDNWYEFARVDEVTGWGDWTDEVYTIYPDGIGVRKVTLHSTHPEAPHEWHEGIIVMGPGQYPEKVLHPEALTMLNMDGDSHTYSWADGAPGDDGDVHDPPAANIQIVNTRSAHRPIVAVLPESKPRWDIYAGELRRDVSMFPWWNHWPTAQDPCDGRYAMAADRASHSSLTHCHWGSHEQTETSMTKIMLNGLSDKSPRDVIRLVKSWANPPKLVVQSNGFTCQGYGPTERAYLVTRNGADARAPLEVIVQASKDQPLVNLALRVEAWGGRPADVLLSGKKPDSDKQVRQGHRLGLDGTDLIVWIKMESTEPVSVVLKPVLE